VACAELVRVNNLIAATLGDIEFFSNHQVRNCGRVTTAAGHDTFLGATYTLLGLELVV
jgi:hypothetical protein